MNKNLKKALLVILSAMLIGAVVGLAAWEPNKEPAIEELTNKSNETMFINESLFKTINASIFKYTESICRQTNKAGSKYTAMRFSLDRGTQNDTLWEEMKKDFFEDDFIRENVRHNCSDVLVLDDKKMYFSNDVNIEYNDADVLEDES